MTAALAGLRVLDLADPSAAFATRILADLGADVVMVEPPAGARARHTSPFLDGEPGPERSLFHQYHDANKRSLVLEPGDTATLQQLLERADVLVETAPPARRAGLGLDPEALRARNPSLIHVSVTPFGSNAQWRDWRANDLVACAAGGLLWLCGEPGSPPVQGAANPAFTMASLVAATGVMLALATRDRDPVRAGAHLDISLQEATVMTVLQTANASWWAWNRHVPGRPGLSAALRCKDGGWVGFVPRPDRFAAFLEWVESEGIESELTSDDWPWARIGAPSRGNPVNATTKQLAARLTQEEFSERAAARDLLVLPITDFPYMERHPHYAENEQFFDVDHAPLGRSLGFVRSPVDAMAREIPIRRAPLLGEHTGEVLAELEIAAVPFRPASGATEATPLRALEGVRVVDFCWVLAGPLGTRILANLGAEVIRVESGRRLDSMRSAPGPDGKIDPDLGGLFNDANTGKKSLTLDLSQPRGRELVKRLIATADVVTNNFRPGALERMGLGYDELVKQQPDVILVNVPGTHRRGPWAPRSTLGNTVMGASGYNHLTGFPGQRPRGLGVAYPDFTSPYLIATTVMAALRERERTGHGQELDLSQLSGMISLLGVEWMHYRATGVQPPPRANRDPDWCPHGVYRTRGDDEWCALAVCGDAEWQTLARLMGREELAGDLRFATHAARKANEDALDQIVSTFTGERERWELAAELQAAGIASAPVESLRDTYERDPQLRNHYQQVRQPTAPDADIPIDGEAIRFSGHPHRLQRAPMLGEHNESVLCGIVGLSQQEYDRLVLDEVVG